MLRMNGQFLTVKKEEGLSPVKHCEFVPEKKNLTIIVFVRHYENENNDNHKSKSFFTL